jgi:hypothetical protein
MTGRALVRFGLLPLLLVSGIVLLAVLQKHAETPREFRGTLLYGVAHIGGEGSSIVLATSDGGYDLFFTREQTGKWDLRALNRKPVMILGRVRTAHGVERKRYRAIDVINLVAE